MSKIIKMVKSNLKLLTRNIGFWICLVLIPFGAAMLLMIQQADVNTEASDKQIIEIYSNSSLIASSVSSALDNTSVIVIDSSQNKTSEMFLESLSAFAVYRYKAPQLSDEEIKSLAKNYYERGTVTAVIYLPPDFGNNLEKAIPPTIKVFKGRDDNRIEFVKNNINNNISIILQCAANSKSKADFIISCRKAFDNLPIATSITVNSENQKLTVSQTNSFSNIGYSLALLSLAFILTGSFIAGQIVSERDNKSLIRIEMSGTSMMNYILAKAITALVVSLIQTAITALAILFIIGNNIGIPFATYIAFVSTLGIIFNFFCVVMGIFSKNVLSAIYMSFGVWIFTNLLSKVYFNFGDMPQWWEKASLLTPQRWVMLCTEMIMKNQNEAYSTFAIASLAFLILIIAIGFIGTKLRISEE